MREEVCMEPFPFDEPAVPFDPGFPE